MEEEQGKKAPEQSKNAEPKFEFEGFKFDIVEESVDDMEFLEYSERVTNGDIVAYVPLVRMLLGDKTYTEAKEYFKKKYGRFTATKCSELFSKAMESVSPKD